MDAKQLAVCDIKWVASEVASDKLCDVEVNVVMKDTKSYSPQKDVAAAIESHQTILSELEISSLCCKAFHLSLS